MKQAILVTAYKNLGFLREIVEAFDHNYTFYIHLDKKGKYADSDIRNLKNHPQIKFLSLEYRVNWGSVDHLRAILLLASEAIKDESVEYIHMITGQDFPIKTPEYISSFLESNKGAEFITADKLPAKKWKNGGLNRVKYYSLYEIFNGRGYGRFPIKALILLQKIFRINRPLPNCFPDLYGGIVYWTLTRNAVKYTLDFLQEHTEVMERFRYTFCSEEILFQSILMNSPFRDKVQFKNLRFIIWEYRRGQYPPDLDERDYEGIVNSEAIFARKFNMPISEKLYNLIRTNILGIGRGD